MQRFKSFFVIYLFTCCEVLCIICCPLFVLQRKLLKVFKLGIRKLSNLRTRNELDSNRSCFLAKNANFWEPFFRNESVFHMIVRVDRVSYKPCFI